MQAWGTLRMLGGELSGFGLGLRRGGLKRGVCGQARGVAR